MRKIIFAGTPDFAAFALQELAKQYEIVAVLTKADKINKRGKQVVFSPVKTLATSLKIPVIQPSSLKSQPIYEQLKSLQADMMVVVAYGHIIPTAILDLFAFGCINIHGSILPKYRGAAPIQHALLNGETTTGISLMQLDSGMDTGPVYKSAKLPIEPFDNSHTLLSKLGVLGANLLIDTLPKIFAKSIKPIPQDSSLASYAPKLLKADGYLNFQADSGEQLVNKIKAYNPNPVAFTTYHDVLVKVLAASFNKLSHEYSLASIIKIDKQGLHVAVKNGIVILEHIIVAGKKPWLKVNILNGRFFTLHQRLG